ncbi:MAG: DUF4386 domain-containing protein [Bacteroidia bacterium]
MNTGLISDFSQRKTAIIAGVSLVVMAITAGFAFGFVFQGLVVPEDAETTAQNIRASLSLFRAGIFGWLIVLILDILVAWALYQFLKTINQSISLLTAWLRLVYVVFLGAGLLNFVFVLLLTRGENYLQVFDTGQQNSMILMFVNGFSGIWSLGLIVFGLHLLGLGYLALRSGFIPRFLGILLVIAGGSYLIVHLGFLLLPAYAGVKTAEMILSLPMAVGELGFAIWLLIRGGKPKIAET